MIINAISGFSASSRKQSDTLGGFLVDVFGLAIGGFWPTNPIELQNSARPNCINESLSFLDEFRDDNDSLLLIGKSLGAVRAWWLAYNHWNEIKHFKKIRVILIDPHGWQRGDGRWGSYGRKMLNGKWRNLNSSWEWYKHPNFKLVNLYQHKWYPRGAMMAGAGSNNRRSKIFTVQNIKLPPGANHWNCTDIKTETGQFVAGVIRDVAEGL